MLEAALDNFEYGITQPAPAPERNHEAHASVVGRIGVARQSADTRHGAGLVGAAVAALQQLGICHKQIEDLCKALCREPIAATKP